MAGHCPECGKRAPGDPKGINYRGDDYHRICQIKTSGQYAAIEVLFRMQDEPDVSPETAIIDMIANIGHFVNTLNRKRRGSNRIDFERAIRCAINHWEVESPRHG